MSVDLRGGAPAVDARVPPIVERGSLVLPRRRLPGTRSGSRSAAVRGARARCRWCLYLPLSALAFGLSKPRRVRVGARCAFRRVRYFLPVLLFGIIGIAVVWRGGFERGGRRAPGAALSSGAALLPGVAEHRDLDGVLEPGGGARYDGYDLSKARAHVLAPKNHSRQAEIRASRRFPSELRARVALGVGFNLAVAKGSRRRGREPSSIREGIVDLDTLLAPVPRGDREELARGAGIGARFSGLRARRAPRPHRPTRADARGRLA